MHSFYSGDEKKDKMGGSSEISWKIALLIKKLFHLIKFAANAWERSVFSVNHTIISGLTTN